MLSGSVLHGYAYGADFSDPCLRAMDDGFALVWPDGKDPWRAESLLGVGCALLLALAWAVVVLGSSWSGPTRLLAGLPALATATAGVVSLLGGSGDALDASFRWLTVAISLLGLVAFVAVAVREAPGARALLQSAVALAGSTAVGFVPSMLDHAFMASFSDANWDAPPGSGYPTVVVVALLAVALLVITLVRRPAGVPAQAASSSASAAVSALP